MIIWTADNRVIRYISAAISHRDRVNRVIGQNGGCSERNFESWERFSSEKGRHNNSPLYWILKYESTQKVLEYKGSRSEAVFIPSWIEESDCRLG
ncbi:hypothetical protein OS493_001775 [Desmophyllum pertusum]|uniref:Uncharacterized protein n=1 Tax=Desmophyllum pertusum TaxID=174260 RepID=A0A9X0CVM5_9CNID|nr:hypothetical protein OS493_001775 [Desmophyllum pertusum]